MKDRINREVINNLSCYCREINMPNFQIALVIKSGSMSEEAEQSGIAHCLEHMNLLWDKHEQDEYFYGHGYTNYFETVYILNCRICDYERAIQIIDNIITGVYINQASLDEAKTDVIKEINETCNNNFEIYKYLFDNDLLMKKVPVGKAADVCELSLEKIRRFYLKNYVSSNMVICIVSPLQIAKYVNTLKKYFKSATNKELLSLNNNCFETNNCILILEKHDVGYEVLLYKHVNLDNWLPDEFRTGYDFFLDIQRKKLFDGLSLDYEIMGITCSLKKFYQGNRILKIRIVLNGKCANILDIVPKVLCSEVESCQISSIKSQYKEYIENKKIYLRHEDLIKECIDEVLGIEKITSIDSERQIINGLLNLSEQEIKDYLQKIFSNISIVRINNCIN
ncbi:MAG: insulinase family protein [Ruminococcus flavefaciens]|nr:insulinase family protein [Ruminococcus flavefaciens]